MDFGFADYVGTHDARLVRRVEDATREVTTLQTLDGPANRFNFRMKGNVLAGRGAFDPFANYLPLKNNKRPNRTIAALFGNSRKHYAPAHVQFMIA
jgi:hypothetical protein